MRHKLTRDQLVSCVRAMVSDEPATDTDLEIRAALTAKQQGYLAMYYVQGASMAEIGQAMGVNKSTVARTIHRALANVQKVF